MTEAPEHILLIDKPKGITSFDVIRRLRKELGIKKMGHAGTLDPLASGLMIIGVGAGTKKLNEYIKLPKTYEAFVMIGEKRTTGDMEGEIVEEKEVEALAEAEVQKVLDDMQGVLALPVPAYSAIKKDGVPLYKRARKGQAVEVPIKEMEVRSATLNSLVCHSGLDPESRVTLEALHLKTQSPSGSLFSTSGSEPGVTALPHSDSTKKRALAHITFDVGSGTYIRSLAEELGKRLGYPATLYNLRRTKVGEFEIENSRRVEGATDSPRLSLDR